MRPTGEVSQSILQAASLPLVLEWSAAVLTIAGAWLLANNGRRAPWGWVLFLAANMAWIAFAWLQAHTGLMVQQLVLTTVSLQGVWKGLIVPRRGRVFAGWIRKAPP
jgi:nicotinamide riboside transporter PnuC